MVQKNKSAIHQREKALATAGRMSRKLEEVRKESRAARAELIESIMCNGRDVLSKANIEEIQKALQKFLGVQKRILTAWYDEGEAAARYLGVGG